MASLDVDKASPLETHRLDAAIFWDYENCPLPNPLPDGVSPTKVLVENIRQLVLEGSSQITQIRAYTELPKQSSAGYTVRSELQMSGVTIVDCPHSGQKDVADKMMMVDMVAFALDTPAPATIVVISGDRDFAYAIAILRNRKYKLNLISGSNVSDRGLRQKVDKVYQWKDVINGCPEDISSALVFSSPSSVTSSLAGMHSRSPSFNGHRRTPSIKNAPGDGRQSTGQFTPSSTPSVLPGLGLGFGWAGTPDRKAAAILPRTAPPTPVLNAASLPIISGTNSEPRPPTFPDTIAKPPEQSLRIEESIETPAVDGRNVLGVTIGQPEIPYHGGNGDNGDGADVGSSTVAQSIVSLHQTLLDVLEDFQHDGKAVVPRGALGHRLMGEKPSTYKDASCKNFKQYMALAESDGLVLCEGRGNAATVSLNVFRDKRTGLWTKKTV